MRPPAPLRCSPLHVTPQPLSHPLRAHSLLACTHAPSRPPTRRLLKYSGVGQLVVDHLGSALQGLPFGGGIAAAALTVVYGRAVQVGPRRGVRREGGLSQGSVAQWRTRKQASAWSPCSLQQPVC